KSEEYLKIQPFGLVPAFIDNKSGQTLIESVSILEYLDETYSDFPLLPEDPLERAKVRALVQAIAMDIQPVTNLRILRYVGDDRKDEWARHFLAEGFTALEAMLQKTAKKFAYGDSLTMADIVLVPQIFNGVRFGLDLNAYPIASRLYQELNEIPEFKATHPTKQADCPEELR
ncbi:Glutathione S-transferase zeta-1, partial [Dissophora globulifera]